MRLILKRLLFLKWKNKLLILGCLFGVMLASCGESGHPLVGETFKLSQDAATETYQGGYDQKSYFALLGSVNNEVSSFVKLDSKIKSFLGSFIKITDTEYNSGYLAFNTEDETSLFAIMVPNDNKGIDSESLNITVSTGEPITVVSAISGVGTESLSFGVVAKTFAKNGDKYEATFVSIYSNSETTDSDVTASFVYNFTK